MTRKKKTIEQKYKKHSQLEHVLARPGMYIGPTDTITDHTWILENQKMIDKILTYNPGIVQLYDELICNAGDHAQENPGKIKDIKITVDEDSISVMNDGPGIPIEIHKEYEIYVPELIFTNFLTSSNYDDDEKRLKGGMNGLGAKLVAAYSTKFTIETVCKGKKYTQVCEDNLSNIKKPKITSSKKSDYTKITFYPDFKRFKIKNITEGLQKVLEKRAYDMAACTDKKVNIWYNEEKLKTRDFESYISLFVGTKKDTPRVIFGNERWSVGVVLNPFDKFTQVSFVNGLFTAHGGTHVDYIVNPICRKITENLKNKHKDAQIRQSYVKDNMLVFVRCLIENPSFESQTKDRLTTRYNKFGSSLPVDENTIKQIIKLGVSDNVLAIANAKDRKAQTATDGKKKIKLTGIPKLDDANKAGGRESRKCTLILTEGDSAKTFATSGLNIIGRDYYGIFPLKGKLLNAREATNKKLLNNQEIANIKAILGLKQGKKYKKLNDMLDDMRYGKMMIVTDQDRDGSHIKGLLINFLHFYWPVLIKKSDFVTCLQTPIVKCSKGRELVTFYNTVEYDQWKKGRTDIKKWKIKYYKGLGTSTSKEAKECFKNLNDKKMIMTIEDESDEEAIILAFKKDRANDRKRWIKKATGKEIYLDPSLKKINIKQFIDEELVLFSIEDCERSIPSMMDGLKPSQRKVLYGSLLKNIKDEIKVDQLRGFIGEKAAYHHGEMSLNETIIGMNANYVGSNNINLFKPGGQLGTRLMGGKDAASPRYVFTSLKKITRHMFKTDDDPLLKYLDDDGYKVEPEYYWPVIPMILVNGTKGVGTGYSTEVPCYNPVDIIKYIKKLLRNEEWEIPAMTPWYKGFKGTIRKVSENSYETRGVWEKVSNGTVRITELPIKTWTQDYKTFLDKITDEGKIKNWIDNTTETLIDLTIKMDRFELDRWINAGKVEKELKLSSKVNTGNIHLFNEKGKLKKYEGPEEILYKFYKCRKKLYTKRYNFLLKELENKVKKISSQLAFIKGIMENTIKVFRVPKKDVIGQLEYNNFPKWEKTYDYLTDMKIDNFTDEKIKQLEKQSSRLQVELSELKKKTSIDLWKEDLVYLEKHL